MCAAVAAGGLSSTATCPLWVFKTRMQHRAAARNTAAAGQEALALARWIRTRKGGALGRHGGVGEAGGGGKQDGWGWGVGGGARLEAEAAAEDEAGDAVGADKEAPAG